MADVNFAGKGMAESPEGKRQKLQGGGGTADEHELAAGAGSSASSSSAGSTSVEDSQSRPSVDDECPMKLDGEDEESEVEDDDLPYLLGMIREEDKPIWAEYNRQVRESEGFDIDILPPNSLLGVYCPDLGFKEVPSCYEKYKNMAKLALKEFNDELGFNFEFVDVEKVVNRVAGGFIFYLTFTGRDMNAAPGADLKWFQATYNELVDDQGVEMCRFRKERSLTQVTQHIVDDQGVEMCRFRKERSLTQVTQHNRIMRMLKCFVRKTCKIVLKVKLAALEKLRGLLKCFRRRKKSL